jgi:hypothetical protein
MRVRTIGIGVAGICLGLSGCGAQVESLPTQFQGQWDQTAALCNDPEGVSRLTIGPTRLGYYEAGGELSGPARQLGERVSGTFRMDGADFADAPAPARNQSGELVLTDHGAGLILTLQGHRQNYVRCTGNRA